jgi:hypothetical protein
VKALDYEWTVNFLSGRNRLSILDAIKEEVWTGLGDSGTVTEETHFTTKGKKEILTETSEAKYITGLSTKGKKEDGKYRT